MFRILVKLLETSRDPLILSVAAHDIGDYVRHYPRGKTYVCEYHFRVSDLACFTSLWTLSPLGELLEQLHVSWIDVHWGKVHAQALPIIESATAVAQHCQGCDSLRSHLMCMTVDHVEAFPSS